MTFRYNTEVMVNREYDIIKILCTTIMFITVALKVYIKYIQYTHKLNLVIKNKCSILK